MNTLKLNVKRASVILLFIEGHPLLLLTAKRPILSTIGHPRNRIMTCTTKCRPLMTSSKVKIGDTIKGSVLVFDLFLGKGDLKNLKPKKAKYLLEWS